MATLLPICLLAAVMAPCFSAPTKEEPDDRQFVQWHQEHWQSGPVIPVNGGRPVVVSGGRPVNVVPVPVVVQSGRYPDGRPNHDHDHHHDHDDDDHDDVSSNNCQWNGKRGRESRCLFWSSYGIKWFFDDDDEYSDRKFYKKFGWPRHHSHDLHHEYKRRTRGKDDNEGREDYRHPHWDHHRQAEIIRRRKDWQGR